MVTSAFAVRRTALTSEKTTMPAKSRRALCVLALVVASFCVVTLVLYWITKPRPLDDSEPPPPGRVEYKRAFEWSDAIPHLYQAAALPPREGVQLLMQKSSVLRTYLAIGFIISPPPENPFRDAKFGDPDLEKAITTRINEIVRNRLDSSGAITSVDYELSRQPYPYTVITAMKMNTQPYAILIFNLTPRTTLTGKQVEAKHGVPQERGVDRDGHTLITYQTGTKSYTAKTQFQLQQGSDRVRSVSISVERKYR